jgi:hypothetical protein
MHTRDRALALRLLPGHSQPHAEAPEALCLYRCHRRVVLRPSWAGIRGGGVEDRGPGEAPRMAMSATAETLNHDIPSCSFEINMGWREDRPEEADGGGLGTKKEGHQSVPLFVSVVTRTISRPGCTSGRRLGCTCSCSGHHQ